MLARKQKSLAQRIEIVSNIAIVLAVVLIAYAVATHRTRLFPSEDPHDVQLGAQLTIPGIDWSAHTGTIVIAVQEGCSYCSASADFYRRLTDAIARTPRVGLVAVLPDGREAAGSYLQSIGLQRCEWRNVNLSAVPVAGTPTVIAVDRHGTVQRLWRGRLKSDQEDSVLYYLGTRQ